MRKITDITGRLGNQMFQFAYIYNQFKKGLIPDIYLQGEEFFKESAGEIKKIFGERIGKIDKVAIHVRRGDYVNNSFYVDLFKDGYYERAMSEFPGAQFMVFSDDIEWCKQQDIFSDCLFSEGFSEVEDINRMASCIGHIIANSSFSWWGAYLSPHNGKVITPSSWFADGAARVSLPINWIRV